MIKVDKSSVEFSGNVLMLSTELAVLMNELRKKDKQLLTAALTCVYTDGGSNDIKKSLELFKEDTALILKGIEEMEKFNNGR